MTTVFRLTDYRRKYRRIFFSRPELNQLLSLYSTQVARGEWRDYAIDQHDGAVLFSVFRHTHESPLFTIVKTSPGVGRQGDYAVMHGRQRLACGTTLGEIVAAVQKLVSPVTVLFDNERRR